MAEIRSMRFMEDRGRLLTKIAKELKVRRFNFQFPLESGAMRGIVAGGIRINNTPLTPLKRGNRA